MELVLAGPEITNEAEAQEHGAWKSAVDKRTS
jgi:hypothetical protein